MPRRQHAFTLIEVLVALAILAIVMTLAWRGTAALADGEARLTAEATRWRTLDAAFSRLEADMRQALPRPSRTGDRRQPAWIAAADATGNTELAFSRAGPEFSQEPGVAGQRVGYRLASGRLEVLYWPELDNPATVAPAAYPLADGIAAFRLDFLTRRGEWVTHWPVDDESGLPRAVRAQVLLGDGQSLERWFALRG